MNTLTIKNLKAQVNAKPILNGVDLVINSGEINVLMGPNASGKSTLAHCLLARPDIKITSGNAMLNRKDILAMTTEQRSLEGLFVCFQNPLGIAGVSVMNLLRLAVNNMEKAHGLALTTPIELSKRIESLLSKLGLAKEFSDRYLNDGFSGGEKKRMELLQMILCQPKIAILDEIDSGVDIDALKMMADLINNAVKTKKIGILLITHNTKFIKMLQPAKIHVFNKGRIIKTGGKELIKQLDVSGYKKF